MMAHQRHVWIGVFLIFVLGNMFSLQAATVTRGPYLQSGTSSSVVVRWRTDVATDSRVQYGTTQGSLTSSTSNSTVTTEHSVSLSGLSSNTKYFYSVGTTTAVLAGNDANHFCVTAPVTGTVKDTRIWVLGDCGTGTASQTAVRDSYYTYTNTTSPHHTDLFLMLGDNAYNTGTDAEYQAKVFAMYPEVLRKSVLWSCIGNHETAQSQATSTSYPYYSIFTFPTAGEAGGLASGTESYYSFDYANIHFICLDSMTSAYRASNSVMATWLANDMANTTQRWIVAYWHHPPYTKGSHNSDTETELIEMRSNILPILEAGGADLVLCGHSHCYERSYLIDGHYGLSTTFTSSNQKNSGSGRADTADGAYSKIGGTHKGTVYTVTGSAGQIAGGSLNHPAMFVSLNQLGSVVLDVNGTTLNVKFLRETGVVDDYYTLTKAQTPPFISNISNQTVNEDIATSALAFTIGDGETAAASLSLTGSSSNTALVPNANIVFGGSGANRTVTVTPALNQSGTSTVTVTVSDGTLSASDTFVLTVNAVNDAPTISNIANLSTNEDIATGAIPFTVGDVETASASLSVSGSSSNTTLIPNSNIVFGGSGANRTVTVTPAANQNGSATITVAVSDGVLPANTTFVLAVNAVNDPPTISNITDKGMPPDSVSGPHNFTVGDIETAAGSLTVSGASSNTTLLPNANIVFGGSGATRTIKLTPAAGKTGTATVTVTVSDGAATATDTFILSVDPSFAPPTVAAAAAIAPTTITTTTAQLSVLGADNSGEPSLTYSWATTGTPPAPVVFSANDTNGAKNSQVTFSAPGTYNFTVTITDVGGLSVTSSVSGTVVATLTTLTVTPAVSELLPLAAQTFIATGSDQFGMPISTGGVIWTASGGSIAASGLFSAPTQLGAITVSATSGTVTGSATVNVAQSQGLQLGSIAILPNPSVAGETVGFMISVTGKSPFTYAWDFGDGSTSSSTNALHVYAGAGSYAVSVLVTDASGATAVASAIATVIDGSGGLPPPLDSDGDGVSDANEIGDGTDPSDATSFVMSPLTILKLRLSVRFDLQNKDAIQFSGVFPGIEAGFSSLGSVMAIDAGGAKSSVTLDARGRGKTSAASVGLKLKFVKDKLTKKSSFIGGDVRFKGSVKAGTWSDEWADDGLTGAADTKKAPLSVPFLIAFNGRLYGTSVSGLYSAKTGKSGKFQK